MKTEQLLFYFIFICLNPVVSLAQDQDILWYNKVDETNNLSLGKYNYFSYQDSEGFVWISSTDGLHRFDGNKTKQYSPDLEDSTSIADEFIQSTFFEDSNKNLWFATYTAIHCYNRSQDNFQRFTVTNSSGDTIKENYKAFYLERDSFLWIHAETDIYRLNIRNPKNFNTIGNTKYVHNFIGKDSLGFVTHIISLDNKNSGLNFFEFENNQVKHKKNYPFLFLEKENGKIKKDSFKFQEALFENPNNIWLTSNLGFIKWDAVKDSFLFVQKIKTAYNGILELNSENLLLSNTTNQLYKVNKNNLSLSPYIFQSVDNPIASFDFQIRHLSLDRENNLWMDVHPNGLIYANPKKTKFQNISKNVLPQLSPDFKFKNFIETKNSTIWSVYNKGIFIFDHKRQLIKSIDCPDIHPNATYINHTLLDQSERIWVAIKKGLSFLEPGENNFQFVNDSDTLEFLYLYQLKNGKILGGTLKSGVFEIYYENSKWNLKNVINDPKKPVGYTSIYEDRLGQIYFCKKNTSLQIYTQGPDSLIHKAEISTQTAVNFFYEANDEKTIWIGTSLGLGSINKNSLKQEGRYLSKKNNFPSNNILGITQKSSDELWICTDKGLTLYNTQNHAVKTFSIEDGVLSNQFDEFAFLELKNGETWLGGLNGITIIPDRITPSIKTASKIIFTEIGINGLDPKNLICNKTQTTNINQIKKLRLDHTQNSITFRFMATDYTAPNGTQLKYKLELEGANENWVSGKKGESGFTQYPELNPGNYTFIVQGANSEGQWGNIKELNIEILPPFWKTWWFITLCALAALGVILFIAKLRINEIRKTSDLKTKIAENKMAALVAQMNPHFIFNSLQSINSYILKNDKQQASEYLTRFSKLMRMILENSRQSTHSLQQEVELLSLYLKVEAQRFKKPFTHSIIIDQNIDPYETFIPAMMLQPFIENAIWHGISNKEDTGHIKVDVSSKNNLLKCAVEDNGVGRKKAAEVSIQKRKTHKSRATEIITDRLKLLFPNDQDRCSIEYIDLIDKDKKPAGTRVEIFLPLLDDA